MPLVSKPVKLNQFRLIAGMHQQKEFNKDADGKLVPLLDEDGKAVLVRGKAVYESETVTYRFNDNNVVESHKDLVALLPNKFQLIGPSKRSMSQEEIDAFGIKPQPETKKPEAKRETATEPEDDGLDKMTVSDLRDLAARDEIDLGDAHLKADIVAAIRLARE